MIRNLNLKKSRFLTTLVTYRDLPLVRCSIVGILALQRVVITKSVVSVSLTLPSYWQNMLVCGKILFKLGYHELGNIDTNIGP